MLQDNIQIPEQISNLIALLLWVMVGLAVLWVVLSVLRYMHRRAYNLTPAETAHAKNIKPDFLTVDHAKRDKAMAGGAAFDAVRAGVPEDGKVATSSKITRLAVFGAALVSFLTAAAAALLKVETIQEFYDKLGSWDRFVAILSTYKIGFAIAAVIIVLNLILFLAHIMDKQRA
jgi:hypothetical protein